MVGTMGMRKHWLVGLAVGVVFVVAVLTGCSTTHVVEVCVPLDSIMTSDSLIVFYKTDC